MAGITTARAVRGTMTVPRAVRRDVLGQQAAARRRGERTAKRMAADWYEWRRRVAALN